MPKLPDSSDLRNPHAHLDLARGDLSVVEQLFAELPTEPEPAELDLEDDGQHSDLCPCWRCDTSPVFGPDEDETFDLRRDLAADRRFS